MKRYGSDAVLPRIMILYRCAGIYVVKYLAYCLFYCKCPHLPIKESEDTCYPKI